MSGPAAPKPTKPGQAKPDQVRPRQTMSQLMRGLWAAVAAPARSPSLPADTVVVHDPAAERPHDLDDPYFDQRAQARMANVIAESAQKK
ncbi:MAG: hypothetical protein PSV22_13985 [Pseudolabrys sp.]|nr:hypothetical protein [Pseudolabrys sp.]